MIPIAAIAAALVPTVTHAQSSRSPRHAWAGSWTPRVEHRPSGPSFSWGLGVDSCRPAVCRPHARCGLDTCTTCRAPVVCRPDARCGLDTCVTCHPTLSPVRYEQLLRRGWDDIAACDYDRAAGTFAYLTDVAPGDARPRIGFAVAEGLRYRDVRAVRAMRRAVDRDPKALLERPVRPIVEAKIRELLAVFEHQTRYGCTDPDQLFMVASLRTLRGDVRGAHHAIEAAIRYGDCSSEAAKLRECLHAVAGTPSYGRRLAWSVRYRPY